MTNEEIAELERVKRSVEVALAYLALVRSELADTKKFLAEVQAARALDRIAAKMREGKLKGTEQWH